jgi:hypothetical protein
VNALREPFFLGSQGKCCLLQNGSPENALLA